jgi:hypothetical protein
MYQYNGKADYHALHRLWQSADGYVTFSMSYTSSTQDLNVHVPSSTHSNWAADICDYKTDAIHLTT